MIYKYFVIIVAGFIMTTTVAHATSYKPDLNCSRADPNDKVAHLLCSNSDAAKADLQFDQTYYALRQIVGTEGQKKLKTEEKADWGKLSVCDNNPAASQPLDPACVISILNAITTKYRGRLSGDALQEASRSIDEHIALQQRLIDLGYLPENTTADGVYGAGMRAAIIAWQNKTGSSKTDGFISDANAAVLIPSAASQTATSPPVTKTNASPQPTSAVSSPNVVQTSQKSTTAQKNTDNGVPLISDNTKPKDDVIKAPYFLNDFPIKNIQEKDSNNFSMFPNSCDMIYTFNGSVSKNNCKSLWIIGSNYTSQSNYTISFIKKHDNSFPYTVLIGTLDNDSLVINRAGMTYSSNEAPQLFPAHGVCTGVKTNNLSCIASYTDDNNSSFMIQGRFSTISDPTPLDRVIMTEKIPNFTDFVKESIENKKFVYDAYQIDNSQKGSCLLGDGTSCEKSYIVFHNLVTDFIVELNGKVLIAEGQKSSPGHYYITDTYSFNYSTENSIVYHPALGECGLLVDKDSTKVSFDCRYGSLGNDSKFSSYGTIIKIPE